MGLGWECGYLYPFSRMTWGKKHAMAAVCVPEKNSSFELGIIHTNWGHLKTQKVGAGADCYRNG